MDPAIVDGQVEVVDEGKFEVDQRVEMESGRVGGFDAFPLA